MKWYDRNEFLIGDNVRPIPLELWNWGMQNKTGALRQESEDIIKLNLLPSDNATVTQYGIKLGKYYYNCKLAERENWYVKARINHSWKICLSYDPNNMNFAYIRLNNGKDYEKCNLLESSSMFKDKYYFEVMDFIEKDKKEQYEYQYTELQEKAIKNAKNMNIATNALIETNKRKPNISDAQRVKGIDDATREESAILNRENAFILGDDDPTNVMPAQVLDNFSEKDYIPPVSYF
jgi:hypothetical protein